MFSVRKSVFILSVVSSLVMGGIVFVPTASAAPATYVVTSSNDEVDANIGDGICETSTSGECTLRAAIEEANSNADLDTIEFNISGTGLHTITTTDAFPNIIQPLIIDGYSQPGSVENTAVAPLPMNSVPTIHLYGDQQDTAITVEAAGTTFRGLIIENYLMALQILESNFTLTGSYIQTNSEGMKTAATSFGGNGILLETGFTGSTLGGTNPEDRNILGASEGASPLALNGSGSFIYGNYLGVGRDGITDLDVGINIMFGSALSGGDSDSGTDNTIGGPQTGQSNVISGADTVNMNLVGSGNLIQGNIIGGDYTGSSNSSITNGIGMNVGPGATGTLIGGTSPGEGNTFIDLSGGAVVVTNFNMEYIPTVIPTDDIAILGNSISGIGVFDYYGFGNSNMGIDLLDVTFINPPSGPPDEFGFQGPTTNDASDSDAGPNSFINSPELVSAQQIGSDLEIQFDLDATGSTSNYRVEFFANDTSTVFGHGPGQTYWGFVEVNVGTDLSTTLDLDSFNAEGKSLSATATEKDTSTDSGFGATSEFSQNIEVGSATDFDSDGVSDATEDAAPNGGDGNDDNILDKYQPTVSSYTVGSIPVTFETTGCSANGSVSSLSTTSLSSDGSFSYPYGLTDFTLNCSRGDTATITKYVFDDTSDPLADYSVRKYRPGTQTYEAVAGSSVVRETIGDSPALVMSYSLEDGGTLDDDGEENGIIVDPVGLAHVLTSSQSTDGLGSTTATGTLSNTGASVLVNQLAFAITILTIGLALAFSTRSRKRHTIR